MLCVDHIWYEIAFLYVIKLSTMYLIGRSLNTDKKQWRWFGRYVQIIDFVYLKVWTWANVEVKIRELPQV